MTCLKLMTLLTPLHGRCKHSIVVLYSNPTALGIVVHVSCTCTCIVYMYLYARGLTDSRVDGTRDL